MTEEAQQQVGPESFVTKAPLLVAVEKWQATTGTPLVRVRIVHATGLTTIDLAPAYAKQIAAELDAAASGGLTIARTLPPPSNGQGPRP